MTRRTHLTLERAPAIGDAIGHYRIVGAVDESRRFYVAEQRGIRGISATVALKVIHPELTEDATFGSLFSDAARIAPRFEHPNVVTIYELGAVGGQHFVSMEYLAAESVASIIEKCTTQGTCLPPDIAAYVVRQAAHATLYLEERRADAGLPDRVDPDALEPSGVFMTYHGTVKLLDVAFFPAARGSSSSGVHPVDPSLQSVASPPTERHRVDGAERRRTDVYRLGALLWVCLTGRLPERAPGDAEEDGEDDAADAGPAPRRLAPSSLRAGVPEALDSITMQALSAEPSPAFQTVRALSDALDRYLGRCDSRPTPKHVRRLMERLFGIERASLSLSIARGQDVEGALARLAALARAGGSAAPGAHPLASLRPRELWSTSHSVFSRLERGSIIVPRAWEGVPGSASHDRARDSSIFPRHVPSTLTIPPVAPSLALDSSVPGRRAPRMGVAAVLMATSALVALGTVAVLASPGERSRFSLASPGSPPPEHHGRIDVRSTPDGAAVFVDGEPTGLRSPVVLKGLEAGRQLSLRVDKAGFVSQTRQVDVVGGALETQRFELLASDGLVHFVAAPPGARIYVDDMPVALDEKPIHLAIGSHALRVETPRSLIFSGPIVIVAGEQTLHVDQLGVAP